MANMKPCQQPQICGVKNHRPGTVCRAERSNKGKGSNLDPLPPMRLRPPSFEATTSDSEYGSMVLNEPNGNWGSTTFALDQDTYEGLPEIDDSNRSAAECIRDGSEFRQPGSSKWRTTHAAYTGEDGDIYTVIRGDKVIAFKDASGNFVMHNTAAGISYGEDQAMIHAASRMDQDGNITPDDSRPFFFVREMVKESDFNDSLKRHLSGEAQDSMPSVSPGEVTFAGDPTPEGITATIREIRSAPEGSPVTIHNAKGKAYIIEREINGEHSMYIKLGEKEIHVETHDNLTYLVRRAAMR